MCHLILTHARPSLMISQLCSCCHVCSPSSPIPVSWNWITGKLYTYGQLIQHIRGLRTFQGWIASIFSVRTCVLHCIFTFNLRLLKRLFYRPKTGMHIHCDSSVVSALCLNDKKRRSQVQEIALSSICWTKWNETSVCRPDNTFKCHLLMSHHSV